jgi:hypothetical protein
MENETMKIFLRLFANCENLNDAHEILARLTKALGNFSPLAVSTPKPYWKIPELFEFTFTLTPPTQDVFQKIVNACDVGWLHMRSELDRSSVWNKTSGQQFLIPEVSWASIDLSQYRSPEIASR